MKLSELAARLGLELRGNGEIDISSAASLEKAGSGAITFAAAPKYAAALRASAASAAIIPAKMAGDAGCPTLVSANPPFDFARVLHILHPPYRPPAGIHPTAVIAENANIGAGAAIGAYCVIGANASIGRNAVIHPHVTIYPDVRIGDDFTCHSHVSIREGVTIGDRVTLLNGAVIGADGFGFLEHNGDLIKVPQIGGVKIEDDVEIGANTAIDRATMGATIIRRGVKLDNLIQIGHNCEVGEFSRMAAQTGLAGSVQVGGWCQFGGQSGFADHSRIGDRVLVMAQAGVHGHTPDNTTVGGTPAIPMSLYRRMVAVRSRLPEVARRLRAIESRLKADDRKRD